MKYSPVNYSDYLKINELLGQQNLRSVELGKPAHDELLFITVHQTYELWFKQMLFELDSTLAIFSHDKIEERLLSTVAHRLARVNEIMRLLIDQVTVLETMTPLDFLDFRDMLYPASGFQSLQFRLLETKLGLKAENRHAFNSQPYHSYVAKPEAQIMLDAEKTPSLFDLVDKWLSRTPFLEDKNFKFWDLYKDAVNKMYERDRETVRHNPMLSLEDRAKNLTNIDEAGKQFHALFDESEFQKLRDEGHYRLSFRGIHAALLVSLYRDEPVLHLPYQVLFQLADLDERMTMWRYRHALMAQRMLGSKIGTGGSSGHKYLKAATERHRIFADLFNLATFFIPRSELPELPDSIKKRMGFQS